MLNIIKQLSYTLQAYIMLAHSATTSYSKLKGSKLKLRIQNWFKIQPPCMPIEGNTGIFSYSIIKIRDFDYQFIRQLFSRLID